MGLKKRFLNEKGFQRSAAKINVAKKQKPNLSLTRHPFITIALMYNRIVWLGAIHQLTYFLANSLYITRILNITFHIIRKPCNYLPARKQLSKPFIATRYPWNWQMTSGVRFFYIPKRPWVLLLQRLTLPTKMWLWSMRWKWEDKCVSDFSLNRFFLSCCMHVLFSLSPPHPPPPS